MLKVYRRLARRRQPGARAAALPDRARLRERARSCSAPTSTPAARSTRRSASSPASCPPSATAGRSRSSSLAGDPSRFLERLERLGEVTGSMHVLLASDSSDPSFAPEEPSAESLALVAATLDEEIEAVFAHLPESEVLAPIAGLGEEVRERLRVLSRMTDRGRVIRHPRQLPPRRPALDGLRLDRARLRGAARSQRGRAPAQALAAARRREHAALVRLRRLGDRAHGRQAAARGLGGAGAGELPARLLRGGRAERLHPGRRGRRPAAARDLRAREGRRRAAPRARGAPRVAARSPWPRSSACSRSRSGSSVGA